MMCANIMQMVNIIVQAVNDAPPGDWRGTLAQRLSELLDETARQ